MIIKLGDLLGRGGYATVYRALDPHDNTPLATAVKKSRVSQRVRRPHLQHEARVLCLLRGHPAIPRVFAYGHPQHFEYLALELLGKSLDELMPKGDMQERTVAKIAVRLISALEFIHSHGLVHRDIKPSNILLSLDQPPTLRLIDFGIARPFHSGAPARRDPVEERHSIPGTLKWVSLHAHLGYDPSRRDDLESLAYTLLYLLRGDLPWQRFDARSGTLFGSMKHVREKKKQWPGARLGAGLPAAFGELLDYARALPFAEQPDYAMLRRGFERLAGDQGEALDLPSVTTTVPPPPPPPPPIPPGPAPVACGEIVYVRFLPRLSIESYTAQVSDPSYWEDASLRGPEWDAKMRPAVVLEVKEPTRDGCWGVKVVPLRRDASSEEAAEGEDAVVRVSPQRSGSGEAEQWPWAPTVAFAFPTAETFLCLPDQPVLTPARWSLPAPACAALARRFDRRLFSRSASAHEQLRCRIQTRSGCRLYAALSPLADPRAEAAAVAGEAIEWHGARGWLDELAKAVEKRLREEAREWCWASSEQVRVAVKEGEHEEDDWPSDSFSDPYTEWWPQGGRDRSTTLGVGDEAMQELEQGIERIEQVIKRDG